MGQDTWAQTLAVPLIRGTLEILISFFVPQILKDEDDRTHTSPLGWGEKCLLSKYGHRSCRQ